MSASASAAANRCDGAVLTSAQCCIVFARNFMLVLLPSWMQVVSPPDEAATLCWTGPAVGAASATPKNR